MIKVFVRRTISPGEPETSQYRFRGVSNVDTSPVATVSLSRNGNGCFYAVDNLQDHNGHAPPWYGSGYSKADSYYQARSISLAPAYIERVRRAIIAAVLRAVEEGRLDEKEIPWWGSQDPEKGEELLLEFPTHIPLEAAVAPSAPTEAPTPAKEEKAIQPVVKQEKVAEETAAKLCRICGKPLPVGRLALCSIECVREADRLRHRKSKEE